MKAFIVDEGETGRLDVWLAAKLAPDYSRNRIKSIIEGGFVTIAGQAILEPKKKIVPGTEVHIELPPATEADPEPENIPLHILYEDNDLIVIDKQAGLVVHPGAGNPKGTLVNALLYHCEDTLSGIGGVKRPGIVHRLDKDTSGVMVMAKNDNAHRHLSNQFQDHGKSGALKRAYQAFVWGTPNPLKGNISTFLGRSRDRLKRAVVSEHAPDAKNAVTHYKVDQKILWGEKQTDLASLVTCELETGRTHQIRVHLAHIGHPLIGDQTYGQAFKSKANKLPDQTKTAINQLARQALHASLLQFEHPKTGEILSFETKLPDDMAHLVTQFHNLG